MSRHMYCAVSALGALILLSTAETASAQWFPRWFDNCGCYRPVAQACYRTVPVTEYRQVRQTVQRPVYETKYVDRKITEYHPVTEQRTTEVPTLTYANVTEHRTVSRDMGRWQTHYRCNPRLSPCQYDSRPTFIGWLNRTGYSMRSALTPRVTAQRQYVPNIVAYDVPVTRRVAQHSTRKVAYNVTRMVPRTTTRKVAVNSVRYVSEEIVRSQPVTVMRTVPIGTATAYGLSPYGAAPRTTLQPQPDGIGGGPSRSANRRNDGFRENRAPQPFRRNESSSRDSRIDIDAKRTSLPIYQRGKDRQPPEPVPQARRSRSTPSIVQVGKWTSRRVVAAEPSIVDPEITVAVSPH